LQYNLPHTSMRDLMVHGNDLIVATHGRSFWVLDDISPLRQLDAAQAQSGPMLFKPGDAYRVRRSTYTDTPLPIDEPAGQNPPDGAVIDFALPASVQGPVTLEIVDQSGKVVRRYANTDAPYATPEELARQLIPLYWLKMPQTLPGGPGMHRWVWDLRYTTPVAPHYEYPISAVPHQTPRVPQGPLALPGNYTVRLTVDGKVLTAPLTVTMDPRVTASSADLQALFKVESGLAETVTESSEADMEAHSAREQIDKLSKNAGGAMKSALEAQDKEVEAMLNGNEKPGGGAEEPGLDGVAGQAQGLYAQVGSADAAPTVAQQSAGEQAAQELKGILERWNRVKSVSIPALNRKLNDAHMPPINLERRPDIMPESGDED
jgi:hypothetical protein